MKEVMSEVVFNRAILFMLFAFECVRTGNRWQVICGVGLAICGLLNAIKSARLYMEGK